MDTSFGCWFDDGCQLIQPFATTDYSSAYQATDEPVDRWGRQKTKGTTPGSPSRWAV